MKTQTGKLHRGLQNALCALAIAVVLHLGMLAGSAQTNIYLFSGSETNITLNPGTCIITAYGAPGGGGIYAGTEGLGPGAEMSAEFNFSTSTILTLLVGGGGVDYSVNFGGWGSGFGGGGGGGGGGGFLGNGTNGIYTSYDGTDGNGGGGSSFETGGGSGRGGNGDSYGGPGGYGGGGGGGSFGAHTDYPTPGGGGGGGGGGYSGGGGGFGNNGEYDGNGGGGGGSIIDSSAIAILTEVSGILSPDDPPNREQDSSGNGEIIIIAVPTPLVITAHAAFGFTNGVFGFNVTGPSGSNVVIQASTDLQTWIPLQTNLLGSGPLHFSDLQSPANVHRFYRAQFLP